MHDYIVRAVSADGFVKAAAIRSTELVRRGAEIQGTTATATAALGRALTAASLMGNMQKVDDGSVTLQFKGDGPLGTILCVSDAVGNVRGYVQNPAVPLLEQYPGKLDVGAAVGRKGMLTVIRDLQMKEPYVGSVQLATGEIAEDITAYFAQSEQTPTACALGVFLERDQSVQVAGGYLLQLLPGADEETISHVEENIKKLAPVSSMIRQGMTPQQIAFQALDGFEPNIIDEYEMGYVCDCTRARVERALISLGKQELEQIRQEGKPIEVGCQFCDKKYVFTPNDVKGLIARL